MGLYGCPVMCLGLPCVGYLYGNNGCLLSSSVINDESKTKTFNEKEKSFVYTYYRTDKTVKTVTKFT